MDPANEQSFKECTKRVSAREKKVLMLAVLESAVVEDFQKHVLAQNPSGKKLFQQVEEWFLEKDSDEIFSFRNICETLQLHSDYIRQGLMIWKEAQDAFC